MKFSVIVPVFNREQIINTVIESVFTQAYKDWEMLFIDDGSTDSTADVCRKASDSDSRIRYIYKTNGGVSSARNLGIREAEGDFIVFLDSDNTLTNNTLEKLRGIIKDNEDVDFIAYGFNTSDSSQWIPVERGSKSIIERDDIRQKILPTHFNIYAQDSNFLCNYVWNKAYRRNFLEKHHILFDETRRIWEDGFFVINCLDNANKIAILSEAIYNAYCNQTVDHLSSKLYENQIIQYINDEKWYKSRFSKEMDFSTPHYIDANFNVVQSLLERMVHQFGEKSRPVIEQAIHSDIVLFWADMYVADNEIGRRLKKYILSGDVSKIYTLFQPTFLSRVARKAFKSLKH